MTPSEYYKIMKVHFDHSLESQKPLLEAIRTQTFHLANLKKGTTYNSFCRNYFPFYWDKKIEVPTKAIDYEESKKLQSMWDEIHKQMNIRG